MSVYVYLTDQCKSDMQKFNLGDNVESLKSRLLEEQRATILDRYPPPFLKKRFGNLRLIIEEREVQEGVAFCFLRILARSSDEYEHFLDRTQSYGKEQLSTLVDDEALQECIVKQKARPDTSSIFPASAMEKAFLWGAPSSVENASTDLFICESELWVEHSADDPVTRRQTRIFEALDEIINESDPSKSELTMSSGETLLYRFFPNLRRLFLAAFVCPGLPLTTSEVLSVYGSMLTGPSEDVDEEAVLRQSVRAYPHIVLADLDTWSDIQTDKSANIALSPEETRVLSSVTRAVSKRDSDVSQGEGFPLFINGRAGSGKSTILQYLFADYLHHYLANRESYEFDVPVYFTYNQELLQTAKDVVVKLLNTNADKLLGEGVLQDVDSGLVERAFKEFHAHLKSYLTGEELRVQFNRSGYVGYAQFRNLWTQKFSRDPNAHKRYGPDLSWHVIRSYIKGMSAEDGSRLDPDEYVQLPSKQKTVSEDLFKLIYERVFESWYEPLAKSDGLWDDQDLALYLIVENRIHGQFPGVFCDESQDFTRLELEILFRLSLFSERSLLPHNLNRVPFAFAGDPFQTLNPTGFRWDAIKAYFVEKFVYSLDPSRTPEKHDLNYRELSYNYRSTRNIVRVCNTIQALRAALFDQPELKPQTTWQHESASPPPVWFTWDDKQAMSNLRQERDITIIIPCAEGEEVEYVKRDTLLADLVDTDETGVPRNVLSASRAKGLEFKRVVLYGFGDDAPEDIPELIEASHEEIPAERLLPLEYFINRVYVAASRPKRRLFIVDSPSGMPFWDFLKHRDLTNRLLGRIRRNREQWKDQLGMIQPGSAESWSEDRENLLEQAKRFEDEGRIKRDAYLLRNAALNYSEIEYTKQSASCRAFALEIEKKFQDAAKEYLRADDHQRAVDVLWRHGDYAGLIELIPRAPFLHDLPEMRVAGFLGNRGGLDEGIKALKGIARDSADTLFAEKLLIDEGWYRALSETLSRIEELNPDKNQWGEILKIIENLDRTGVPIPPDKHANVYARLGQNQRALEIWQEAGDTKSEQYKQVLLLTRPYPENVVGMRDLGLYEEILEQYRVNPEVLLAREAKESVLQALKLYGDPGEVLEFGLQQGSLEAISQELRVTAESGIEDSAKTIDILKAILKVLVDQGRFVDAVKSLRDTELPINSVPRSVVETLRDNRQELHFFLIELLARSEKVVKADADVRRTVAKYLKGILFNIPGPWLRDIGVRVAGAAIERSAQEKEVLDFYERLIKSREVESEDQDFANIRWAVAKLRQSVIDDQHNRKHQARQRRKEAERRLDQSGWQQKSKPPLYPELPVLDISWAQDLGGQLPELTESQSGSTETHEIGLPKTPAFAGNSNSAVDLPFDSVSEAPPSKVELEAGNLRFAYYPERGRLNVEDTVKGNVMRIDGPARSFNGDFDFVPQREESVWTCEEWQLDCIFLDLDPQSHMVVRFRDSGVSLQFPLPDSAVV